MTTKPKARRRPPRAAGGTLADQLRGVIHARRLTSYAVAAAAGVSASQVFRFLNGERSLSLETFDRIAAALGLRLIEGRRPAAPRKPLPPAAAAAEIQG